MKDGKPCNVTNYFIQAAAIPKGLSNPPKIGGKYNWIGQAERLIYLGKNGYWHQFAKIESPSTVWCEVLDEDLHMLEETNP